MMHHSPWWKLSLLLDQQLFIEYLFISDSFIPCQFFNHEVNACLKYMTFMREQMNVSNGTLS